MTSKADVIGLIQRGIARHHLVNNLNVSNRTQAHVVLVYAFTQVAVFVSLALVITCIIA